MPNRYTRDEIILVALGMAQLANLERHDAPFGVVVPEAFSLQWLQDILDFWYHIAPFSATVVKIPINCTTNSDTIILPADFILDVRNGLLVQTVPNDIRSYKRAIRVPLQKFINRQIHTQQQAGDVKYPAFYCIVGDDGVITTQYQTMLVAPTPTIATQCQLWYYQLPALLTATQKPKFPDDYACIEYIRLRALEWAGIMTPGTAKKFCTDIVAQYKAAGLLNEPEDDEIPMDEQVYRRGSSNRHAVYGWMGER